MLQLQQRYNELKQLNTEVVVIGPENPEKFQNYWLKEKLNFIGLSDPTHEVLKLYGQKISLFKLGRQPAQLFINKAGFIRFVHYGHSMRDIPNVDELIDVISSSI
jgi:peroxiredoxin Q/BCP